MSYIHLQSYENPPINDCPYDVDTLFTLIFEAPRSVTTRRRWTLSHTDFELYGVIVTGDNESDEGSMEDWVNTTRTVAELAEWHADGKEFIIRNPKSQEAIYQDILEYTNYVAWQLNRNSVQYIHFDAENDDDFKEVLNDVIKLQNLANRIFPRMVANLPQGVPMRGLLGFLAERSIARNGYSIGPRLEFNPYERYGFTQDQLNNEEMYSKEEGTFNAVDIRRQFNPDTLSKLRKVI